MKRHDAHKRLRHPLHAAHEDIAHLADVAERGESAATPAVLIGAVALVVFPLVAAVIAVAFTAAYLATPETTASSSAQSASTSAGTCDSRSSVRPDACRAAHRPVGRLSRTGASATVWSVESGGKSWRRSGRSSPSHS